MTQRYIDEINVIMDQLYFEAKRHLTLSKLCEEEIIAEGHRQAVSDMLWARFLVSKELDPNSNSQTFGNIEDPKPLSFDALQGMNSQTVYVAIQCDGGTKVIIPSLVACNAYSDDDPDEVYLTNNLGGRCTYGEVLKEGGTVYARKPNEYRKASKEFYSPDKKV